MGMNNKKPENGRLGAQEIQLLSYAQMYSKATLRAGEAAAALGVTPEQERKLLSRLASSGMIIRLKRGAYLMPAKLPPGGVWTAGEYVILAELMHACGNGRCQFCGPTAFYFHKLTDQVPNRVFVYNNRLSGDRTIGGMQYSFIRTADSRLGDTEPFAVPGAEGLAMPTKARTLVDAVYDWSRFNTLPLALQWIADECSRDKALVAALAEAAAAFGNQGTIRRIGWALETVGAPAAVLRKLEAKLKSRLSLVPLVPALPTAGKVCRRWGAVINDR